MADFPALPLFTDAYLADTRHLSTEEHGAYLLLLFEAWRRPECCLPDNDALLARLAGLSAERWAQIKTTVMALWERDGRKKTWSQKRLLKERAYVAQKSASQRDKAVKRWNGDKKTDATALHLQCPEDAPTPTPTPIKKERGKPLSLAPDGFEEFWQAVPRKVAKDKALPAYAKALRKADARTLIEGMRRYAQSRIGEDPQYTAHPASWLNAGRWQDEPLSKDAPRGNAHGTDKGQRKLDAFIAGSTGAPPVDRGQDLHPSLPLLARG